MMTGKLARWLMIHNCIVYKLARKMIITEGPKGGAEMAMHWSHFWLNDGFCVLLLSASSPSSLRLPLLFHAAPAARCSATLFPHCPSSLSALQTDPAALCLKKTFPSLLTLLRSA